jgi:GT2 family glycosyltransferase
MDVPPDLSVSIVTYNSADCLTCLYDSLIRQEGVRWELFVVDNASTDDTGRMLLDWGLGHITRNVKNVGFGRGHNQNRDHFRGRYLLFLNPDLVLPPGLFSAIVAFLDENPSIAMAGPTILEGSERALFAPRRFYPGEALLPLESGLDRHEVAWLTGCCLAVRRLVFESIGGFDPDFFLYCEDTDLCYRARQAGYRLGWFPQLEVLHHGRRSQSESSEYERARTLFTGATVFWEKRYPVRDVASMLRFQLLAAGILLQTFRVFRNAWQNEPRLRPDRLRGRREACSDWLIRRHYRLFPLDARSWRIIARQLRLFVEWVCRGGSLPLDDF